MTGSAVAADLVGRGLDARELDAKAALFDRALTACSGSSHASWVPGRLEVFGKHTDYGGGRTLVAAVPRGFAFAARPRSDDAIHVVDARTNEAVTIVASEQDLPLRGWRNYVATVVRRLRTNFPDARLGADVAFASDLPPAAGMSSSSALVVGIADALVRLSGVDGGAAWRRQVRTPLDAASYFACIENGSAFGSLAGDSGVGTHGGSEDHAAMLQARAGCVSAFAFVPARLLDTVSLPLEWTFVIAPSGVTAEKTGGAQDLYNRLSAGVRVLLQIWNARESAVPSLAAALQSSPDAGDRLRAHVRSARVDGWTVDALERRLDHFVREDARVERAVTALAKADAQALGELAGNSQAEAESLLGNQVPETIALARSARERGAFAACSFGAGFGGSVWALVEAAGADAFAARWHPAAFVARPGPPLTHM